MTVLQGIAAYALWKTGRFTTQEIAEVMAVPEAEVYNLLHAASRRPSAPDLTLLDGGKM